MYERPGRGFYVPAATKAVLHQDPATEHGIVGCTIKQKAKGWAEGLGANYARVEVGEPFHIRTKGIRQVRTEAGSPGVAVAAASLGQGVYIRPSDNTLRLAGATAVGDLPFGRVVEIIGAQNRGVPANKIRIDLDQKDTLAAA